MIQPEALLQDLAPETWGDRLARARNSRGLTLDQVEGILAGFYPISRGPVSRLERSGGPPQTAKSRRHVGVLALLYGYQPSSFGIAMDEVPAFIRAEAIARSHAGSAPPPPPVSSGTDHQVVWPITITPVWQVDADLEQAA